MFNDLQNTHNRHPQLALKYGMSLAYLKTDVCFIINDL